MNQRQQKPQTKPVRGRRVPLSEFKQRQRDERDRLVKQCGG
jgi:hypothetical protein